MWLRNADGSRSEVSGNGVRCLAAWLVEAGLVAPDSEDPVIIQTDAGAKTLWPTGQEGRRRFFRAAMGAPSGVRRERVRVGGEELAVATVSVGNPHCVVLGEASEARLHAYGLALATHPSFPEGTNVEFAEVEAPGTVRIVIWERGVGPTRASGTGACAAAVAAAAFGGAARDVEVVSPGGAQRVEWRDDGIYLTGWAEVVLEGQWLSTLPDQVMA
jgi:diaminopimelate epimerase